jgi:hypothetical protein
MTTKKRIDMTDSIHWSAMHKYMAVPLKDINLTFKGEEVEFILSTLNKVHGSLIATIKDADASPAERKTAYEFALSTEKLYGNIFQQLKLVKPERTELN